VLDDEQLGIDVRRCDGCKLCVAACPEGAIQADLVPVLKDNAGHTVAMLACEHSGADAGTGTVPCLHAICLNDLIAFYRKGVDTLVSCSADCDNCSRGRAQRLELRLEKVNLLLRERRLPAIRYRKVTAGEWSRIGEQLPTASGGSSMSRRQFFRRATQVAVLEQTALRGLSDPSVGDFSPPGALIPSQGTNQTVPFAPQIDPARCNACDACVRLCPHAAIRVDDADLANNRAYVIRPDQCTGCGICTDVCDQQAISVSTWTRPVLLRIPLTTDRCRGCGAVFHAPVGSQTEKRKCRICVLTGSHKLLYQVLD
jgi:Pyruvate/2-oxoacid:ferredoxin oxidoreductase delta subunit